MRLSALAHPVAGHGRLCRVLVPDARLRNTWVRPPTLTGYGKITGCRADLLRLGALIRMAASSPHSAVHVPLRKNDLADEIAYWFRDVEPVDLLIIRKDIGLRPSAWPELRAGFRRRASEARPLTLRTPEPRAPHYIQDDRISLTEHAGTLMISGPASALHQVGDVMTEAGELIASNRDIHQWGHAILSSLTWILRGDGGAPQGTEFDIYGLDPIFHKARWA
ncbi:hypothetical protein AB5J62_22360 [Amycolatopsis sp. cg5]|uniref:hypothetical protein n=1 Tax=Amycolatopsis sp. cg5 TaxID=3238802 RepID=UPI0035267DC0